MFFNIFVYMQIFNEINCRKLKSDEYNVFADFFNNFLFSINNQQRWLLKPNFYSRYSIYLNSQYGPTFGGGHDIYLYSLENAYTYKHSYYLEGTDPDVSSSFGFHEGLAGPTGLQNGTIIISRIEVWALNTSGTPLN